MAKKETAAKKPAAKKDAALERTDRVLDRVKDNEELLRVTVELTKELKTIVLEMQNKMKMINS